jgi:hypothetical protein
MHLPSNFFPSTTRNFFVSEVLPATGIPQPPPNRSFIQALRIAARKAINVRFDDVDYRAASNRGGAKPLTTPANTRSNTPNSIPQSNPVARPLPREAATTAVRRETQAEPPAAKQDATQKSTTTDPAAERRKNAAYGASRGTEAKNNPAPKQRKRPRDPSSDKVENSKEYERIQQAEAAIPGAMAGNWRDLRTVFELAGISEPSKEAPTASESAASEPR